VYDFSVLISYSVLLDIAMRAYLYYHAHCTNNSRMQRYSIALDFPVQSGDSSHAARPCDVYFWNVG